ncbi:MAG: hypothetical protein NTZ65_02370 [Candidatus Berkelbacteria bacterium]|nr:hypothetical protein [Candidatus Berkelbacteria bacterium]
MRYPRFVYIPQAVFANQKDDERIFVVARRHAIDFVISSWALVILVIAPIFVFSLGAKSILQSVIFTDVLSRDITVIFFLLYFLMLAIIFMTSWIGYYYNLLIISEEGIIEVAQKGLFNREIYEVLFDQIEDVSYHTHGFFKHYV